MTEATSEAPQAKLRPKNQITLPSEIVVALHAREGDLIKFEYDSESGLVSLRATRVIASDQAWFWTPEWQKKEREADEDIAAGRVTHFDSGDEFLASLAASMHTRPAAPSETTD